MDLTRAYRALEKGDPEPLFRSASARFADCSDVMTAVHLSESDSQTLIAATLYFDNDVEVVREAQALGAKGGRIDLLILPTAGSPVKHTFLVELKYLSKAEGKTESAVKEAKEKALSQLRRYARCSNIRGISNLKYVAAVFVGTQLAEFVTEDGGGEAQS